MDSKYPIDIVIPWVDGSDSSWLKEKSIYIKDNRSTVLDHNFRDWGLLKYWFRGVEKNLPWVRKVYFVTWGHTPIWLNKDSPKLEIVNHRDYIPDEYLPTFSANTIELNFHRIKGLSEHFIYSNDDTFFMSPLKKRDFFRKGKPCDTAIINPIAPANNDCISHMQLTNAAIINQHFAKHNVIRNNITGWFNLKYGSLLLLNVIFIPWGRFPGILEKHLPSSLCKSTYAEVWELERKLLDETCHHRFRDFKLDVNQWLLKEWQICSGNFSPRSSSFGKLIAVKDLKSAKNACRLIRMRKYKSICINDHLDNGDDIDTIIQMVTSAFEDVFPDKSSFEL